MKYLLMIYSDEKADATATKEDREASYRDYNAYTESMTKAGAYGAGEALLPTSSATSVRVQNGKCVATHGPFAETKEQLGGFYLIDVQNLDEAIDWASKCPGARYGTVEVRPIMAM